MQYTFSQACRRLAGRTHGLTGGDVKESINDAIQALSGLSGWECLRRVLRFSSVGPRFTLPQGSAGLVRLCVNGRPTTVRTPDFRFIHSGPGDLRNPPPGFHHIKPESVLDGGRKPVVVDPPVPFKCFAYADTSGEPPLVVRGLDTSGREVVTSIPMTASSTEISDAVPETTEFSVISEVVVDDCASSYATLYCVETGSGNRYPISLYHPSVKAPFFRQYEIPGVGPGQPVDLLAEVRIDPLPLVRDTDVVPFDSLEPIEWMIRANWCMQSGEVDQAKKYQDYAERWLKAREVADDHVQTSVIINNAFTNSLGEMSMECVNI